MSYSPMALVARRLRYLASVSFTEVLCVRPQLQSRTAADSGEQGIFEG